MFAVDIAKPFIVIINKMTYLVISYHSINRYDFFTRIYI